jgi:hypothetical protein
VTSVDHNATRSHWLPRRHWRGSYYLSDVGLVLFWSPLLTRTKQISLLPLNRYVQIWADIDYRDIRSLRDYLQSLHVRAKIIGLPKFGSRLLPSTSFPTLPLFIYYCRGYRLSCKNRSYKHLYKLINSFTHKYA